MSLVADSKTAHIERTPRAWFYAVLHHGGGIWGRVCDVILVVLILVSIAGVVAESDHGLAERYDHLFVTLEWATTAVFSLEYLLRVWTIVEEAQFAKPFSGRLRYLLTAMALIDLIAVLPFYLGFMGVVDLRVLRALRLVRLLRVLKIGRYAESVAHIGAVVKSKKEELAVTLMMMFLMLIVSSSLVYYAEHDAQPTVFSSIPVTMWWGVATLTTVGYGDMTPVTLMGRCFGGLSALLGVGIVALPAGIVASGFAQALEEKKRAARESAYHAGGASLHCPHCGHTMRVDVHKD